MRFLCRIGFHDYGKWERYTATKTMTQFQKGQKIEAKIPTEIQVAKCKACDFEKMRELAR